MKCSMSQTIKGALLLVLNASAILNSATLRAKEPVDYGDPGSKSKPFRAMTVAAPFGSLAASLKSAIFTEDFNRAAKLIGRNRQAQSSLPVRHGHELPGWSKLGADMPAHWVEQYPGDWVFMLAANRAAQNVFTQNQGFEANDKGHVYTASFDAGPAVYAAISQATAAAGRIRRGGRL